MKDQVILFGLVADHSITFLSVVLLLVPLIYRLITDGYKILVEEEEVDHKKQTLRSVGIGFICSLFIWLSEPVRTLAQPAVLSIAIFWLFFDYSLNLIRGKKWYYIDENALKGDGGPSSWFDKRYASFGPIPTLFMKLWFMMVALGFYFGLSYIVSNY